MGVKMSALAQKISWAGSGRWAGKRHDNTQGPWFERRIDAANWLIYGEENSFDTFFDQYLKTALWFLTDDDGYPLDAEFGPADFSKKGLGAMRQEAKNFLAYPGVTEAIEETGGDYSKAGLDFWLAQNGHGAGFWDGGWPEPRATLLTNAAESFENVDLYVSREKVHVL